MASGSGLALVVSANLNELRARLAEAKNELNTTASAMKAMGNAYDGARTIANMNAAFAVVEKLGGVTKLTDAEQARLNATLNTGIDKLKALGQAVPTNIQAYADQTKAAVTHTQTMSSSTDTLIGSVTKLAGAFGIAFSATAVISGIKNLISGAIEMASSVEDTSQKLGVSAEKLQGWNAAARLGGATAEDVSTAVAKMNANLGGGSSGTIQALTLTGLKFAEIRTMKPEDAFERIVTAIMKIPDPMTRARVAVELFGKGGQVLLPAISDDIVKIGDASAKMSNDTVLRLKAAGDAWLTFKNKITITTGEALAYVMSLSDTNAKVKEHIEYLRRAAEGTANYYGTQQQARAELNELLKKFPQYAVAHADVSLAVDRSVVGHDAFRAALAAAQKVLTNLTPAQRAEIAAAVEMNTTNDELIKTFNLQNTTVTLTEQVIALFKDQQTAATAATKKSREENEKHKAQMDDWNNVTLKAANTAWGEFIGKIGAATLSMPAHLVAAQALAQAHKNLSPEVTAAAMAMAQAGVSSEEIARRLKEAKQATDDDIPSLKNLVTNTQDWQKKLETLSQPLAVVLKGLKEQKLSVDPLTVAAQALAEAHRQLSPTVAEAAKQMFAAGLSADEVFKRLKDAGQAADADKPKIEALAKAHYTLADALSDAGQMFTQMAQIAGESWGPILKGVGQSVVAMGALLKAQEAYNKSSSAANLAALASGYVGLAIAVYQLAKAFYDAGADARKAREELEFTNKIIADVGPVSKSAVGSIRELAKSYDLAIAEALNLSEILTKGINANSIAFAEQKVLDLANALAFGYLKADDIGKALTEIGNNVKAMGEYFEKTGGVWDKAFKDLIENLRTSGLEITAVNDLLNQQTKKAVDGLTTFLTAGGNAYDTLAEKQKELAKLQADYAEASPDQQEKIQQAIAKVTAEIQVQQNIVAATGIVTQASADAFGASLAGVFAKLVDGGATALEAIRKMEPAISALETQLKAAGLSGGASFQVLKGFVDIATDAVAGPALDAVSGLNSALAGMNNLGLLNQDTFAGLTGQVSQTYNALIAQGKDGDTVMRLMQPTLQTMWELEEKFGFKADDATQALLDQAKGADIVGERHKSMAEQMLDLTQKILDALERLSGNYRTGIPGDLKVMSQASQRAFQSVQDDIAAIPTTIPIDVTWNVEPFDPGNVPQPNGAAMGGLVTPRGVQYLGTGGFVPKGTDVIPAMLTPGEGIVTRSGMSRLGTDGLRMLNHGQTPGSFSTAAMERRLASIEALLANQPRAMKLAMKEALVMAA